MKSEIRNPKSERNLKYENRNHDDDDQVGSRSDPAKVAVGFNPRCDDEKGPSSRSDDRLDADFNRRSATDAAGLPPVRGLKSTATFTVSLRDGRASQGGRAVILAGMTPERHITQLANGEFDHVLFLDAVEFGGEPGAVVLLNSSEIAARFPQVSTHKLSLGLLAKMIDARGTTKAWLLGVQPASLRKGASLAPKVEASIELLTDLLADVAQTSSLLYRRLPVGQSSEVRTASGLEIRDTAEWNSALRLPAAERTSRISDFEFVSNFGFRVSDFPIPC
ncbi:MAG: hydrogenase maturation protease [Verrucomicrobia bacterium]|nr:hydrogenase maturation protease [Verrucomicrobiota bacterium]